MSAHAGAGSRKLADRAVILAAVAGLLGLAITVTAAAALMFGGATDPIKTTVDQPGSLEPGYVDYGLRQPEAVNQLQPGYVDFGLRQRPAAADQLQPGYVDFGLRQRPAAADQLQPGYVDFGLRHP